MCFFASSHEVNLTEKCFVQLFCLFIASNSKQTAKSYSTRVTYDFFCQVAEDLAEKECFNWLFKMPKSALINFAPLIWPI